MPGVDRHCLTEHRVTGIGVMLGMFVRLHLMMLVRGCAKRLHILIPSRRGIGLRHLAESGRAERKRHAGREHAKQIEQSDKPPRLGARRSRQVYEHSLPAIPSLARKLTPIAGSAKAGAASYILSTTSASVRFTLLVPSVFFSCSATSLISQFLTNQ